MPYNIILLKFLDNLLDSTAKIMTSTICVRRHSRRGHTVVRHVGRAQHIARHIAGVGPLFFLKGKTTAFASCSEPCKYASLFLTPLRFLPKRMTTVLTLHTSSD